jgi:hypothetical protein
MAEEIGKKIADVTRLVRIKGERTAAAEEIGKKIANVTR